MDTTSTTIIRTYELFDVAWEDGARWTAYNTEAEAQAIIDGSVARGGRTGTVVRRTWDVTITPEHAHLYQPGVSDRPAVYEVRTVGRTHYVARISDGQFLGLGFSSKTAAQKACDNANLPREAKANHLGQGNARVGRIDGRSTDAKLPSEILA